MIRLNYKSGLIALLINFYPAYIYAADQPPEIARPPHHVLHSRGLGNTPSGLTPSQISVAYGFNYVPYQGEGQIIAIVDAYDDPTIEDDLAAFNAEFDLPACTTANGCFTKIYASGNQPAQDNDWAVEMALDVEWAHAMAPKAKIILVEADNATFAALFTAIDVAVAHNAKTISLSWGGNEFAGQTAYEKRILAHVTNSSVTFVAASGDSGYHVSYPASSAYILAVGGTSLSIDSAGNYLSESAWSGSGGGLSAYSRESASQLSLAIPKANLKRGVPDVAYHADPNNGYSVYDTANNGWLVVGGTSAGAPQWAALIALAKSGTHKNLKNVYSALYTLGKSNYKYYYNDIVSGTNGSCGYYCTSRIGYDYVTGIGSPQALYVVSGLMYNGYLSH